jgi:hypothetical protein
MSPVDIHQRMSVESANQGFRGRFIVLPQFLEKRALRILGSLLRVHSGMGKEVPRLLPVIGGPRLSKEGIEPGRHRGT